MKQSDLKKLNKKLYLAGLVAFGALLLLYWFLAHSFISLTVSPRDAIVTIDEAPVRLSLLGKVQKTVSPGLHTVRVEADGYVDFVQSAEFKKSQRKSFKIDLIQTPQPAKISDDAKFLTKAADTNSVYYLGDKGRTFFKATVELNGNSEPELSNNIAITDRRLSGIEEVVWSPDFGLALFRKRDGIYLFDFHKYDFINQTETKWGSDIGSIAWSPDNSKIAYFYAPKSGERSLIFANVTNTEITRVVNLADFGIENSLLRWSPDSEWLTVVPRSTSSYDSNKIYLFNAYSRELKPFTETGNQIDALFSPDSSKLIYSTYSKDPSNPVSSLVSIAGKDGSNARSLDLRAELGKIFWLKDNRNLIAASYSDDKKREAIFGFDTQTKGKNKFSITSLNIGYIDTIFTSNDEKIIFYQTTEGAFAIKAE